MPAFWTGFFLSQQLLFVHLWYVKLQANDMGSGRQPGALTTLQEVFQGVPRIAEAVDLLEPMLKPNSADRPTVCEVLQHAFL